MSLPSLADLRGYVLDMDGVIYIGPTLRRGTQPFIAYLKAQGIPYLLLTNNSRRTSAMYAQKLAEMGLSVDPHAIMGSAEATATWMRGEFAPGARVLPIGDRGLVTELETAGFTIVDARPADAVVVGIDLDFTYDKARRATLAIRDGARFIGTNPDTTFPSPEGITPGAGSLHAMLETASGVRPTIIGKPSLPMMEEALRRVGLPAAQTGMIGDRLDTDILGGQRADMPTIFLHGGVTSDAELEASPIRPDWIFDDLGDLLATLQRQR